MTEMSLAIRFPNKRNETLRGILQTPDAPFRAGKKDLVIFPNGGIMGCEGDFRAHVRIANHLRENGFYSLRFSPSGFGLSDGTIPDSNQRDLFGKMEKGMVVDDLKAAVEFARSEIRPDSCVLSGICGGAISSFLAASQIKEVNYVVPFGVPVILDSSENVDVQRMSRNQAENIIKAYRTKIFSPKAWARALSLKSDFSTVKIAAKKLFQKKSGAADFYMEGGKYRMNGEFFLAADRMFKSHSKKKALFIFGDSDRFCWEFENLYIKETFGDMQNLPFDYYLVPNGNHMLTLVEMQMDAVEVMLQWLRRNLE